MLSLNYKVRNLNNGQIFFRDERDNIIRFYHEIGYCYIDEPKIALNSKSFPYSEEMKKN